MFKKAIKRDAKLRLALCGPAGSGKTFSLLKLATELGGPIAYVDTEHGSASKYAHTDKCGGPGVCTDTSHFVFDVTEPVQFDPRDLMESINFAVKNGYRSICIDSLSHYWMGVGGELELVDAAAKRDTRGNSFAAWKTVTPIHNQLVDLILSAQIHVLVAMRTKTEWVIEKDEKTGKNVPRKLGMAPVMRDGVEYEFDVCGDLDQDNNLTVSKSRCSKLSGKVINRPGREMAEDLREWLAGAPSDPLPASATPSGPVPVPDARPIPAELAETLNNLSKDRIAPAFTKLEKELTALGHAEIYNARVLEMRAKFPKGTTIPTEAIKECLTDLWFEIAKACLARDQQQKTAPVQQAATPAAPAPVIEKPGLAPEVEAAWNRMGSNPDKIREEIATLYGELVEASGSIDKAEEEYQRVLAENGDPFKKVMIARRVIVHMWQRLTAYRTQTNPAVDDSDVPAIIGSNGQSAMFDGRTAEEVYGQ